MKYFRCWKHLHTLHNITSNWSNRFSAFSFFWSYLHALHVTDKNVLLDSLQQCLRIVSTRHLLSRCLSTSMQTNPRFFPQLFLLPCYSMSLRYSLYHIGKLTTPFWLHRHTYGSIHHSQSHKQLSPLTVCPSLSLCSGTVGGTASGQLHCEDVLLLRSTSCEFYAHSQLAFHCSWPPVHSFLHHLQESHSSFLHYET